MWFFPPVAGETVEDGAAVAGVGIEPGRTQMGVLHGVGARAITGGGGNKVTGVLRGGPPGTAGSPGVNTLA